MNEIIYKVDGYEFATLHKVGTVSSIIGTIYINGVTKEASIVTDEILDGPYGFYREKIDVLQHIKVKLIGGTLTINVLIEKHELKIQAENGERKV